MQCYYNCTVLVKSTMTLCMVPCLFHNVHTCCFWRSHHYLINKLSYKRNSFNEQVSTLRKMNKTISVIKYTISVKDSHLCAIFVKKQFQVHFIKQPTTPLCISHQDYFKPTMNQHNIKSNPRLPQSHSNNCRIMIYNIH